MLERKLPTNLHVVFMYLLYNDNSEFFYCLSGILAKRLFSMVTFWHCNQTIDVDTLIQYSCDYIDIRVLRFSWNYIYAYHLKAE